MPLSNDMTLVIQELYIYPVKSLSGIKLTQAIATSKGLQFDREWAILDKQGQTLTQRKLPRMARIQPSLQDGGLTLRTEGLEDITFPLPQNTQNDEHQREVKIWKDACSAIPAKKHVNDWLQEALDYAEPLELVYYDKSSKRLPGYPERFGENATYFADAAPYLFANTASLEELNATLKGKGLEQVDIRRFRPNVVFSGIPAFHEHNVSQVYRNDINQKFALIDHCQRCAIITINPDTAEKTMGALPFPQLTQLNPMPNNQKAPAFGVNTTLSQGENTSIKVGDRLSYQLASNFR